MLANFFEVSNQPIYHIKTLLLMLRLNNGVRDKSNEVDSGCLLKKKILFSMLHVFIHMYNLQNIKIFYYRFCADTHSNWTSLPESWIQ
jgi:hypothetical protein